MPRDLLLVGLSYFVKVFEDYVLVYVNYTAHVRCFVSFTCIATRKPVHRIPVTLVLLFIAHKNKKQ